MAETTRRRLLGATLAAPALLRSAGHARADERLDFPSWQAQEPGLGAWWRQVIAAFEQQHPGVAVDFTPVPFPQYVTTLTTRFAGGQPPDIVHLPSRSFAGFAAQDWLAPLDDVLKGTGVDTEWSPLQAEMTWDGKVEGLLLMGYGMMLFYNEALLRQAGLGVPTTPDAWLDAIGRLTDRTAGRFGIADCTIEHPNLSVAASCWVYGEGRDWVADGRYHFVDPAVVAAIEQYRKAMGFAPPGMSTEAARPIFLQGKAAFWRDGPWFWAALADAPPPVRDSLKMALLPFANVPGGTSNSLHMPAGLAGRKRDLVADFIRLVTTPPIQRSYWLVTGSPASRRNVLSEDDLKANPHLRLAADAAAKAVNIFPVVPSLRENYNDFARMVSQALMRLLASDAQAPQVMADLERQLGQRIPLPA
jgi:multiple sugar transport system substrate-binding protein